MLLPTKLKSFSLYHLLTLLHRITHVLFPDSQVAFSVLELEQEWIYLEQSSFNCAWTLSLSRCRRSRLQIQSSEIQQRSTLSETLRLEELKERKRETVINVSECISLIYNRRQRSASFAASRGNLSPWLSLSLGRVQISMPGLMGMIRHVNRCRRS
ncbi:uncharacterized protein LOC143735330 isoform X2 [Siphateles boraxobius]|uniref:uncharacterized protein LOC143735330 isoform X2 n=1 Tax=Siphateles boraxobius TaxID=180520 RepID=UPI0040637E5D